jgi:benzaldehyde dehydrogenase (NAD)
MDVQPSDPSGGRCALGPIISNREAERIEALAIGKQLQVGHLHINDQTVAAGPCAPFGGRGRSGNGSRISGPANWEEFTQWQWITIRDAAGQYPF